MSPAIAEVGSAANSYEILAKLAVGGMAEIFLARGASTAGVERYVVLKRVLRHRATDANFVVMFLDEARLAAQLQHPNIAQVYDIGKLGDSYFFTMEYVHGETVRTLLQSSHAMRRQLPIGSVLTIIAGAAAGLHHAHERKGIDGRHLGIVHRDVSPSNLMVSFEGTVKVVDFGVAKADRRETETRSGTVKGKVTYMSPEQCRGGHVDRRSDLFSLGIVMWEMLTAERLFNRVTDFENMQAIVSDHVPPPSTRRREIPREIDDIVMRLLKKSPADRYQSGDELHEALEAAAMATGSTLSASSLARFMRELVGQRPEPWVQLQGDASVIEPQGTELLGESGVSASELDMQLSNVPMLPQPTSTQDMRGPRPLMPTIPLRVHSQSIAVSTLAEVKSLVDKHSLQVAPEVPARMSADAPSHSTSDATMDMSADPPVALAADDPTSTKSPAAPETKPIYARARASQPMRPTSMTALAHAPTLPMHPPATPSAPGSSLPSHAAPAAPPPSHAAPATPLPPHTTPLPPHATPLPPHAVTATPTPNIYVAAAAVTATPTPNIYVAAAAVTPPSGPRYPLVDPQYPVVRREASPIGSGDVAAAYQARALRIPKPRGRRSPPVVIILSVVALGILVGVAIALGGGDVDSGSKSRSEPIALGSAVLENSSSVPAAGGSPEPMSASIEVKPTNVETTTDVDTQPPGVDVAPANAEPTDAEPTDVAPANAEPTDAEPIKVEPKAKHEPKTKTKTQPKSTKPETTIATSFRANRFGDVVAACSSTKVSPSTATACTVAACKRRDAAKARQWISQVPASKRAAVAKTCNGVLKSEQPTTATDRCKLDPMACQH